MTRATERKLRGAFFTPTALSDFLCDWAIRSPKDEILEPSCGEAVFLVSAVNRLRALGLTDLDPQRLHGFDLHRESLELAAGAMAKLNAGAVLKVGDFLEQDTVRQYDVIIGNPPYVRYQNYKGIARARGREVALAQGVRLTGLASSWAAFLVHATAFLRPKGRLALVLPAELLSVNYAGPIRRYLLQRFKQVRLILFEELIFPGVLEEVVLLLAEGQGPTDHFELVQAKNTTALDDLRPGRWFPKAIEEKWVSALVPAEASSIYTELVSGNNFTSLSEWGRTSLGIVTGNNKYFTLSGDQAKANGLAARDLMPICPPGSRHLRGLAFENNLWEALKSQNNRVFLFYPNQKKPLSHAASAYIAKGEEMGVHQAYKCRVRTPWWRVPICDVPDLFLTYMNHETPQLATNRAELRFLNSVHGLYLKPEYLQIGRDLLAIGMLNSVTLLGAEIVGRAYGGGMLKLEPKEADNLPVPAPSLLMEAEADLRALRPQLAVNLRQASLREAAKKVDRVLLYARLHLQQTHVQALRQGKEYMSARRIARGKKKK